ncbi:MAG: sugar ABC transporter permease [Amaricoccus sp.]
MPVFKNPYWVMPTVAALTIWWTTGFNVLLFIAGLRNIPSDLYEAAALDGATRRQAFWRVTWPLLWPVTALVLTLQLILQLKIFDQIYLRRARGAPSTPPTSSCCRSIARPSSLTTAAPAPRSPWSSSS